MSGRGPQSGDTPADSGRRRILRAGAGGLAAAALGAAVRVRPAEAATDDYRALVCVFLLGGNDSCNMLVPTGGPEYAAYAASRQDLAVAAADLHPVTTPPALGTRYGFHPAMPELATLYEAGRLAVVANVGPLIQPTTRDDVLANAVPLPPQLYSHNDQQEQWQTLKGRTGLTTGWAGRLADELAPLAAAQVLPVGTALAGGLRLQAGAAAGPYVLGPDGAPTYFALTDPSVPFVTERRAAFEALLAAPTDNPIRRALVDVHRRALARAAAATAALGRVPPLATMFPPGTLGPQLAMVARLIGARADLAMRRQVFLVAMGGFDTHDDQNVRQPVLFAELSAALGAFDSALAELGVADRVVTFTHSDFGRTLTSNGDGTDHGWGGHQLVLGGPVAGRTIHGPMPSLATGGGDDVGGGRLVPARSVDQYVATLVRWVGLDEAAVDRVVPGLGRFPLRDLGFLAGA
jgi:uncharacterized protein (DUF1501 family)